MNREYNILFIEDDHIDQMAIKRFIRFEQHPFKHDLAASVDEAKTKITENSYDAIISDYHLGDGTAFDLFGDINDIPLIFVTGQGGQEIAVKAMKAGAYDFVTKDTDGDYLRTLPILVENAVKRKEAELELEKYRNHLEELVQVRTAELHNEIEIRKKAEKEILQFNAQLEARVKERTKQLENALQELKYENEERKRAQNALLKSNEELQVLNDTLAEESQKLVNLNEMLAKSEEKMKIANDTKDKFFSIIAHDLKNPMQILLLSSELLWKFYENNDFERMLKHILRLKTTSINLKELLENLLTWSRSQRGIIDYKPKPLSLYSISQNVLEFVKENALRKKLTLTSSIPENAVIYADPNLLATVLRNLIINSIKFTPEGGKIICEYSEKENFGEISITDTGIGISEKDLPKLFRIDIHHTTIGTSDEKGTGLGLILCKEFVEQQHGKISVKSKPGEGSTFTFTVPLNNMDTASTE